MTPSPVDPFDFDPAPVTRQKLSDQVFDRLWEMIVSGQLAPGDVIPSERVLMEKFAVGRPAVREALQALANKGVISISHGERSRVKELNANIALDQVDEVAKLLLSAEPSNLGHLKQVRRILEAGTVQIAAQQATDADIEDLHAIIARQRANKDKPQGFVAADIAFHTALAQMTRNPLLQAVTMAMLNWLFEYYQPLLRWSGREETTLDEHTALVEHLARGDGAGAAKLMHAHLDRSDPLYQSNS